MLFILVFLLFGVASASAVELSEETAQLKEVDLSLAAVIERALATHQIGEKNGSEIEVLSGINLGETVVTDGSFSLKSEFLKAEIGSDEHGH